MPRELGPPGNSLRALRNDIVDPTIAAHRGRIVKLMGDGMLVEFASIVEATLCAITIQEDVERHEAGKPTDQRISFRIGVNLGDVMVEDSDIYGDGVNLASRLEGLARPGGICISAKVYNEIRGKIDAPFLDIGEKQVKNLSYPVHVFELVVSPEIGDHASALTDRMAEPALRLNMLGGFEACGRGGDVITVPGRKTEMLLAVLARAGKSGMPREKLLGLLWSDRGNDQARSSLRQTVWSLRRTFEPLEPSPLRVEGDLLALDPNSVETDVQLFEHLADEATPEALEEAVAIYNGEFLEGLVLRDPAGEDWLFYERERLNGLARGVFLRFLEHLIRSGQGNRAIETGQRLLGFDPLNEEAYRALMRLYMAQGQRALALQQFETCSRVLRRELGVRPEAETEALKAEIEGSRQPLHASAGEIRLSAEPDRPVTQPPSEGGAQPRGERKQATVLSADLIETAAYDEETELEESAAWQKNAMAVMSASVERYGGIVKTTPDGSLLALFGAPIAFEDHALRSCLAALDMRTDLDGIVTGQGKSHGDRLALRIGINSGEVVIRPGQREREE